MPTNSASEETVAPLSNQARRIKPKKSARRLTLVDGLCRHLGDRVVYGPLDIWDRPEDFIKAFLHNGIVQRLQALLRELAPALDEEAALRRARHAVVWEGDVNRKIHNFEFLGVQHRPDFEVLLRDLRIAIEVKRGDSGGEVRAGIGQAIVYSQLYDFVIYLMIDASDHRTICASLEGEREQQFLARLWREHNVRLIVV